MEDLRFVMDCLKELKTKDSGIDHEMSPITDMYAMLAQYLPDGTIDLVRERARPGWIAIRNALCLELCVCVCVCGRTSLSRWKR
jgi:hypothetical protein